jgi:hypothetical protein
MQQFKHRTRQFLLEYSAAVRNESLVLCYMDESYIHHHHQFDGGYYPLDPTIRCARKGTRGRRHIIVHAMTEDGLLHVDQKLTCEWIFQSNPGGRDYHTNMNGDNFMKWIETQFEPTFRAKYGPDKKAALVLDNAPYHHARHPASPNVSAMNKSQLLETMKKLDIQTLTTIRNGEQLSFNLDTWFQLGQVPKFPTGPSKDEMADFLMRKNQT